MTPDNTLDFDYKPATENHSIIKVVGVGGGGSNAVEHMYETGIDDVSFLIINTDRQALNASVIPNKLLIGEKGLGAGAKPEVARQYAEESVEAIRHALQDGTEMVFITAGMGGGTGTGAAPIVAQISHELGILTIGIVTIPFKFEGRNKILMALQGVSAIEQWCDALLVVNNNRLIDIYPDLNFGNAFGKADDTLTTAAKSISDIINKRGYINLDFADVSTTLRNGGVALISTGTASGEGRLSKAIEAARHSPLLQDNEITDAKHLLFELCFSHDDPLTMAEIAEMNNFVEGLNTDIHVIWGAMYDDELGSNVRIILLASGFAMSHGQNDVYVKPRLEEKARQMQTQLRASIADYTNRIGEFDGCTEASELLLAALRAAEDKAEHFTIDDSLDEERAHLATAYQQAQLRKLQLQAEADAAARAAAEAAAAAAAKAKEEAEAQARAAAEAAARAKAEAEAKAAAAAKAKEEAEAQARAAAEAAARAKAEAEAAAAKAKEEAEAAAAKIAAQSAQPTQPAQSPQTPQPAASRPQTPQTPPVSAARPQSPLTPQQGIEAIRAFYGEETARRMELSEIRKAYFTLDEQDLTNEQFIERLEHLPAYNRSLDDVAQLKALRQQPAKPRTASHPEGSSGSIF